MSSLLWPLFVAQGAAGYTIEVASVVAEPGAAVTVEVRLRTAGQSIAGTQNQIDFDPGTVPIRARLDGEPDCSPNPAIDKDNTLFAFQPPGCGAVGQPCIAVRTLVVASDNVDPIPDGAVLYSCRVDVAAAAEPGVYPLLISDVGAAEPDGSEAPDARGVSGAITVPGEAPPAPIAYVTASPGVVLINTRTNAVVGTIALNEVPSFLSLSPDGATLYGTAESEFIYVMDTASRSLRTTITNVPRHTGVSFSPDGSTVYAMRYLADPPSSVSLIDAASNLVTGNILLEADIFVRLGVRPDGRKGYIPRAFAILEDDPFDVTVVDLERNEIESVIPIPCGGVMFDLAFTPAGDRLYIPVLGDVRCSGATTAGATPCEADCNGNNVVTVDELIVAVRIALQQSPPDACAAYTGSGPVQIDALVRAVNRLLAGCDAIAAPPGDFTAVVDTESQQVIGVIDLGCAHLACGGAAAGVAGQEPTGLPGLGIAIAPDGRFAYVTSCGDGLCVIDLSDDSLVGSIPLPGFPYNIDITPDGRRAYVTDNGAAGVSVIDLEQRTLLATIPLGFAIDVVVGPPP